MKGNDPLNICTDLPLVAVVTNNGGGLHIIYFGGVSVRKLSKFHPGSKLILTYKGTWLVTEVFRKIHRESEKQSNKKCAGHLGVLVELLRWERGNLDRLCHPARSPQRPWDYISALNSVCTAK